jgi:hypothetical protein
VLGGFLPMETEFATRVFVVCPNGANKGIRYLWTRRWTRRGVIHESECQLNVTAGAIMPNLLESLHSCKDRESDLLLLVATDTSEEAIARGLRFQEVHSLREVLTRDTFVRRVKEIVWRPHGTLAGALVAQMEEG